MLRRLRVGLLIRLRWRLVRGSARCRLRCWLVGAVAGRHRLLLGGRLIIWCGRLGLGLLARPGAGLRLCRRYRRGRRLERLLYRLRLCKRRRLRRLRLGIRLIRLLRWLRSRHRGRL